MGVEESNTFRELLGPDYARLIDVGDHCLCDAAGTILNIDSELPQLTDGKPLELQIVRREVRSLWTDRCAALRDIVVVALIGNDENVRLSRAMIRLLQAEGITAAGFRDAEALRTAMGSDAVKGFRVCCMFADEAALESACEIAPEGRMERTGLEVCLGYAFKAGMDPRTDILRESLPWTVRMPPLAVSGGQLAVACQRLVTSSLYDFENYPRNGGGERESLRDAVLHKYDQWSKLVRALDGAHVDRGMTRFLRAWLTEFSGSGALSPLTVNALVSGIAELWPLRDAIGESLDMGDNPRIFKKATELLEIQMKWKESAVT
jgi:hypothetical protein